MVFFIIFMNEILGLTEWNILSKCYNISFIFVIYTIHTIYLFSNDKYN